MTDKLIIFDTTLRDGEQSPGASMTKDEKLRIARQLERLKVNVIEAGFAASSNGDFEAVKAIADGDAAQGIKGLDPILTGQLTREEIEKAESDPEHRLHLAKEKVRVPEPKSRKKGPRYTPVAKRQDRPDAIAWLLKIHPELQDSQVARLVGSTKSTVQSVRDRSHWNMQNVRPRDPVTLGLCMLKDLNDAVDKARRKAAREDAAKKKAQAKAGAAVEAEKEVVDPAEADQPDVGETSQS